MDRKYLILIFLVEICACKPKSENLVSNQDFTLSEDVVLRKIDSIKIDFLGNPTVHDIDPQSRTVLFVQYYLASFEDIYVANFEGIVHASFSKSRDVPDTYGSLMANLKIVNEYSFLAYGYNGFMTYDFEGKLLSRVKLNDFQIPNYASLLMGYGMEGIRDKYIYINQSSPINNDYSNINMYKDMYLLDLLNPATGEKKPIIQFPETSLFRNGKYFFRNAWDPVFHLADNKLYVAFGLEPTIYAFEDSGQYTLDFSLPLVLPEYKYFKGAGEYSDDFSFFGLRFTSGMILNIKKFDGYFFVAYFPGYDALDTETFLENKSPEETKIFLERVGKKYPNRIAIIDSLGNVISDFVPDRLVAESMLLRNGELWMMEKPDEELERDYFRLFKVGLKIEK